MNKIIDLLGNRAEYYLGHTCKTIDKSLIHVPSADTIDKRCGLIRTEISAR